MTPDARESADAGPGGHATVLRVLVVATFVVILNETILVNAIPSLMRVFDVDARAAQWLSTAFMLTMAVVIPATGWFLQRVGTRAAFAVAMGFFATGTAVAALAPTFEVLLAARIVQACGTAVMMPLLMSTLLVLVPEDHRGAVMGNVSLAISVAPALGPTVSGLVLSVASWRWIFGVVLPIAVAVTVIGLRRLPDVGERSEDRLDVLSVALTAVGFGSLVYGLSQVGGEHTAATVPPLGVLAVGALGLVLFAWRQRTLQRVGAPLLDLRVLRDRGYAVALGVMALAFMTLMGAVILLPLFLQQVRGLSTLQAGLLVMPGGVLMGLLGPHVGRLYDRVGPRALVVPGAGALVAAMAGLAWATVAAPWWVFLLLHMTTSVALAFIFTPVFTSGLSSLPPHLYPHGSAMLGAAQQVAAATGTALVVTVASAKAAGLTAGGVAAGAALGGGVRSAYLLTIGMAAFAFVIAWGLRGRPATA